MNGCGARNLTAVLALKLRPCRSEADREQGALAAYALSVRRCTMN
jgi:hypothetical protein